MLNTMIKRTALLIALPFLIWTGYWAASAYAIKKSILLARGNTQVPGLNAQFEVASVTGYPQRFSVGVSDIEVETRNSFIWKTQEVILEAKSYSPNEVSLDLSEPHRISGSLGLLNMDAGNAKLTALFQPNWQLALGNINLIFEDLRISYESHWDASIGKASASLKSFPDNTRAYQLNIELEDFNLSDVFDGIPKEYQTIQNVSLVTEVLLASPLDRLIIGNGAPELQVLLVQKAQFDFGASVISVDGKLAYDENDAITGVVNVTVQGWESLFSLARDMGYVEPNLENLFTMMLADLASQDGSSETLTIPLDIQNNKISYGALALGILP